MSDVTYIVKIMPMPRILLLLLYIYAPVIYLEILDIYIYIIFCGLPVLNCQTQTSLSSKIKQVELGSCSFPGLGTMIGFYGPIVQTLRQPSSPQGMQKWLSDTKHYQQTSIWDRTLHHVLFLFKPSIQILSQPFFFFLNK